MSGRRPPRVAINGRFLTVPVSGVQRYARELVGALVDLEALDAVVILPPGEVLELRDLTEAAGRDPTETWSGALGHAWEQVVLPALVRKLGSDLLVSPCNWGPIGMRAQLPLFHDVAPMFHPQYFTPSYVRLAQQVTPRLVRRAERSAVTCGRVKQELIRYAGARADRIDVVPPGVGAPFTDVDVDPDRPRSPRCVFIGGYDVRKNLGFLWRMWPRVHEELGLELHVVARSWTSTRRIDGHSTAAVPDGVVVHVDTDDVALAHLLADSLCLLWPSHYEGYGLPLLEAMAVGTPFLSSDTGAARELAVVAEQVLPLCADQWFDQLRRWRTTDPVDLRRASMDRARRATWARSAEALVEAVERTVAA